jgi:hypothetical protein
MHRQTDYSEIHFPTIRNSYIDLLPPVSGVTYESEKYILASQPTSRKKKDRYKTKFTKIFLQLIWSLRHRGFHSSAAEGSGLPGCDAVLLYG